MSPIWQYVNDDALGETVVRAVRGVPVQNLNGKIAGTQVRLANGTRAWAMLSNIDVSNPRFTQHFLTLSVWRDHSWFTMARYHDHDSAKRGPDFVCDGEGKVTTIFLYSDPSRCFKEVVQDLTFSSSRQDVMARLGPPSKSGGRLSDPILGEYGPWDRFTRSGYAIHVEYRLDADVINKITLMRADVVP